MVEESQDLYTCLFFAHLPDAAYELDKHTVHKIHVLNKK